MGLEEPGQAGLQPHEVGPVASLEESTPLFGDGGRVLEVLLEQLTREARVQRIDIVRHPFSLARPAGGTA